MLTKQDLKVLHQQSHCKVKLKWQQTRQQQPLQDKIRQRPARQCMLKLKQILTSSTRKASKEFYSCYKNQWQHQQHRRQHLLRRQQRLPKRQQLRLLKHLQQRLPKHLQQRLPKHLQLQQLNLQQHQLQQQWLQRRRVVE